MYRKCMIPDGIPDKVDGDVKSAPSDNDVESYDVKERQMAQMKQM